MADLEAGFGGYGGCPPPFLKKKEKKKKNKERKSVKWRRGRGYFRYNW